MAAYGSLMSLNFTIQHIPNSFLENKPHITHLKEKIAFLLEFLENYYSQRSSSRVLIKDLEIEITNACHAAEDVIEAHSFDQVPVIPDEDGNKSYIFTRWRELISNSEQGTAEEEMRTLGIEVTDMGLPTSVYPSVLKSGDIGEENSYVLFFEDVLKVVQEFGSIKKKAMKIMDVIENHEARRFSDTGRSGSYASGADNMMVGFDDDLICIMDRITSYKSNLQILPVVGMGGIGKTTLTHRVFENKLIKERFKIRLWSTITQTYNVQDVFQSFIHALEIGEASTKGDNIELEDKLYKTLSGRRYLIVLDDVWSVEVWDSIRRFLPDSGNGSRIIVTTRLLSVASYVGSCQPYELQFLDEDDSWYLLKQKVFAHNRCPSGLEHTGRKIALSCKGLPLAISVVGGLLAKSNMTAEYWEYVAGAITSIINSDNDEYCLDVLSLSYDNLPLHLKPCFLSMGVFPEDHDVRVTDLIKFWVAEGFLKPIASKCLEDIAVQSLKDLVDRNLILVSKLSSTGKLKSCRIHDLLRDLCVREAHKQNFLCVDWSDNRLPGIDGVYDSSILYPWRSTYLDVELNSLFEDGLNLENLLLIRSRCLRLSAYATKDVLSSALSSLSKFWNLQTLIMNEMPRGETLILPPQVWQMILLRHVQIQRVILPDPLNEKEHHVLEGMQTLLNVQNFKISEEVLKRIPNLRKLKLSYIQASEEVEWPSYCLDNLIHFHSLESLSCAMYERMSATRISFPTSLTKLTLDGGQNPWEDMTMVGLLPNLEVLKLHNDAFWGDKWVPIDGEFCRLKSLHFRNMSLAQWEADSIHFPRLESLIFCDVHQMEEIPVNIGDIATLKLMSFEHCSTSLVNSARQIKEEQDGMGNDGIQLHVTM